MNRARWFRYLGAFATVAITLATALTLRAGRGLPFLSPMFVLMIAVAIGLNVVKFVVWGMLNQRYDLSKTYPLTSIFYPLIFIVGLVMGETVFSATKLLGLLFIVVGLVWFERCGVGV